MYDFKKDEAKPFNAVIDGLKLHFVNSNELNILSFPPKRRNQPLINESGQPNLQSQFENNSKYNRRSHQTL